MAASTRTLSSLAIDQTAVVTRVLSGATKLAPASQEATSASRPAKPNGALRRRLLELGLLPGTKVTLIRRAPMGDPIELRLRGYSLSIREAEASAVEVTPIHATQPSRSHALSPAE